MSCGGHISFGETAEDTIRRELAEELGIHDPKPILVEKYILKQQNQTEFVYLYCMMLNCNGNEFVLQKEEAEQVKWIEVWKAQM